jgi:outer membrane receptor protein involved in Fe transport
MRLRFTATLVAALLLVCSTAALAFDGRVMNKATGKPVPGAEVMIIGMTGSVKTDADGRFSWNPNPSLPFQVLIVLPGGRVTKPMDVTTHDFNTLLTLDVTAVLNEEVTVSAGVAPSIDAAPAAGMTMLSNRDIALRVPNNLNQALENVPGVNQVSEGQAAVPAVRGLARGRTLILIDGARVTSERRVGPSATFMDPFVVDGIDIARGPGSVAYGTDAFGGVISIRTRRPDMSNRAWAGRATGTLGAGVPDRKGGVELSKGYGKGAFLVQAHMRDTEDYEGPETTVLNSGWSDRGFLARLDHQMGRGVVSLGWQSDYARDIERPRNNSAATRFYYPFENSHRFTAGYQIGRVGGLDQLDIQSFFGTFEQRTDQDRIPTASVTRRIERADISANDFSLRAIAKKATGRVRLEFGGDINGRSGLEAHDILIGFDANGNQASLTDNLSTESARRVDTGIFVQADAPVISKVTAAGGLRFDHVGTKNVGGFFGDQSVSHDAWAGFGSIVIGPFDGLSFTGQVSRGFRDPTISDRFYRGPTGRGFITGNPDLEPETSVQFDLGVRYTTGRVQLAAYGYHYRIRNLVERYSTATDFFFFRNRGRAQIRGIELELQADLGQGFSLEMSGQTSRGKALDDNPGAGNTEPWLDDIGPDTVMATLRKRITDKGSAHVRLALLKKDERNGPSEIDSPGVTLLDAGGSWWLSPHLELRALGRNLLNREYYASPDPRFVLAPGRHGSVTFVVQF